MGIFSPPLAHFANHLRATQFADASSLVVSDIILVNPHSHCLFFPFCDCVLWQPHVERRQPWTDRGERWWQSRKKKIPPEKTTTTQPNSASMSNSFERHYPGRRSVVSIREEWWPQVV
jgi:hypothetical protein